MTASINDSLKMDSEDNIQEKSTSSSTTFTISFEDEDKNINAIKQRKIIKTANMFTKRHYRTLSLPVVIIFLSYSIYFSFKSYLIIFFYNLENRIIDHR